MMRFHRYDRFRFWIVAIVLVVLMTTLSSVFSSVLVEGFMTTKAKTNYFGVSRSISTSSVGPLCQIQQREGREENEEDDQTDYYYTHYKSNSNGDSDDDILRRQRRRRQQRRQSSSSNYISILDDMEEDEEKDADESSVYRRYRRRKRRQTENPGLFPRVIRTTSRKISNVIPEELQTIGSKATRIAKQKTKKAWKDFQEMTFEEYDSLYYDEPEDPYYSENNNRRRRRPPQPQSRTTARRIQRTSSRPSTPVDRDEYEYTSSHSSSSSIPQQRPKRRNESTEDLTSGRFVSGPAPSAPAVEQQEQRYQQKGQNKDSGEPERAPIRAILQALDDQGILYPPNASRSQLEDLLTKAQGKTMNNKTKASSTKATESDDTTSKTTASESSSIDSPEDDVKEDGASQDSFLYPEIVDEAGREFKPAPTTPKTKKSKQNKKTNAWKRVRDFGATATSSTSLFSSSSSKRKTRNVGKAKDDEESIVDAIVIAKVKDADNDDDFIEVHPMWQEQGADSFSRRRRSGQSSPRRPRRSMPTARAPPPSSTRSRGRRSPRPRRRSSSNPYTSRATGRRPPPTGMSPETPSLPQLPPLDSMDDERRYQERQQRPRKIYSPYARDYGNDGEDDYYYDDNGDTLAELGNFVANSVDAFLWGSDDGRPSRRRSSPNPNGENNSSSARKNTQKRGNRRRRRRHWKDRMEEQFDYVMGIHPESGKYYKRWAEQELADEQSDPSSSQRRQTKERKKKKFKNRRPVWEEDESLLSLLFGTTEEQFQQNSLLYRRNEGRRSKGPIQSLIPLPNGSLLRLTQNLLQTASVLGGALGKWASVRGSIPQPVVVVGVLSAGLSARPGRRLRSVIVALLALRMVGELLHGYIHDDVDFDDDDYFQQRRPRNKYEEYDDDDYDDDDDDDSADNEVGDAKGTAKKETKED